MPVQVGLAVVYTVTGAKSMRIIEVLNTGNEDATMLKYTFIFGVVQLLLSQIPDFAHLWVVSIIGAVMSLCYSLLSGVLAMAAAASDDVPPDYGKRDSGPDFWRGVFTSLGAVTFAYGGHSVLLEIQATLRVPPEAKQSMMRGAPGDAVCMRLMQRRAARRRSALPCSAFARTLDCTPFAY